MALPDAKVPSAQPTHKLKTLFDGESLFLLVAPAKGRWWCLKYRPGGNEKLLGFGTYPQVSLGEARAKRGL